MNHIKLSGCSCVCVCVCPAETCRLCSRSLTFLRRRAGYLPCRKSPNSCLHVSLKPRQWGVELWMIRTTGSGLECWFTNEVHCTDKKKKKKEKEEEHVEGYADGAERAWIWIKMSLKLCFFTDMCLKTKSFVWYFVYFWGLASNSKKTLQKTPFLFTCCLRGPVSCARFCKTTDTF